jgi:Raf kinase inhibitor-like YbhB/YbcL family protein
MILGGFVSMTKKSWSLVAFLALAMGSGTWACSSPSSPPPDDEGEGGSGAGGSDGEGGKGSGGRGGSGRGGSGAGGAMAASGGSGAGGAQNGNGGSGAGGAMAANGGSGAGGSGAGGSSPDAQPDTTPDVGGMGGAMGGPMMLTSTDLIMAMGMPSNQLKPEQCRRNNQGAHNQSPALEWTPGPEGTMSYAISFYDMNNNGTHWVLYNVPPTVTKLPANFNKMSTMPMEIPGSRQTSFGGETGYFGPGAGCRAYRFEVWALKVPTIAGGGSNNALRGSLAGMLVNPMARAKLDVRGQNSGAPCGPIAGYNPNNPTYP